MPESSSRLLRGAVVVTAAFAVAGCCALVLKAFTGSRFTRAAKSRRAVR
jgi:hypothetical protein